MNEIILVTVTAIFSTVVGSGGVLAYLNYFKDKRESDASFDANEALKYRERVHDLEEEMREIQSTQIPSSVPEWRKDGGRRYVYVSPSYEIQILFPIGLSFQEMIGKTDQEIFTDYPEFVKTMREIDDAAQRGIDHIAIRRRVQFPSIKDTRVVIKEIGQDNSRNSFYIGRCYPDRMFEK